MRKLTLVMEVLVNFGHKKIKMKKKLGLNILVGLYRFEAMVCVVVFSFFSPVIFKY